jgi:general secretion pathway protein K
MKKILSNERGIALMMILTSILFLTVIYGDFTFDSKISRLKATNIMDRSQAKLLAESGLQMAMTRLRLYKEAFNTIQNNQNLRNAVPAQLLNQLWEIPYMYPIPVGEGAGRVAKDAIDKFQKESVIDGEMRVTVQNISNRLNLNMLRIDMQKLTLANQQGNDQDRDDDSEYTSSATRDDNTRTDFSVDTALYQTMKRLVDEKKEKDDAFNDRYGSLDYQDLFTNLKFYMSDFGTSNIDPLFGEAEQVFVKVPMTPKFGPMTSASELYAIPGWDDQLIELIQNEFSVYPTTQIDLNKITGNFLKILIPGLNDDTVKKFFDEKNNEQDPKNFNSLGDFKKFVTQDMDMISEADFDERIKMFEKKGITFGSNPNMFKVISEGIFNRSTYTLVATVILPKQEQAPATPPATQPGSTPAQPAPQPGQPATPQNQSTQLLEPRIIEIQVN